MPNPSFWSSQFLINTTTSGYQEAATVQALSNGRFVVAWNDLSETGADTSEYAVRAQMFNADGSRLGTEFLVNTTVNQSQASPSIAALADGRFVITWDDNSESAGDSSASAVRAQLYLADGTPSGPDFVVNQTTLNSQTSSHVTSLLDGRFAVAWTDGSATGADTSGNAVRLQLFSADGVPIGVERLVNTTTTGGQQYPVIAALANGRFVVAWSDLSQTGGDTSAQAVRAQVFNADSSPLGTEFLVNTTTASFQVVTGITALVDGRFVVIWMDGSSSGADTSEYAVRAQVFDADGSLSGAEFLVNTSTSGTQWAPSITALADGRFVAVWEDNSLDGLSSVRSVRAQVFEADGGLSGTEFRIDTPGPGSNAGFPSITALTDGRLVVAWSGLSGTGDDTSISSIHAQIVDPRLKGVDVQGSNGGNDLVGTQWNDVFQGGMGNDRLVGVGGSDMLRGESGNDSLAGDAGNDRLFGDEGNDALSGGTGSDELWGGDGNDALNGGAGGDAMVGGAGNDRYTVDTVADLVIEDSLAGTDRVSSGLISLNLAHYANVENASLSGSQTLGLTGGAGNNSLSGNSGANLIVGLGGNDSLGGGAGLDTLVGGTGKDLLTGGTEADTFVWRAKTEAGLAAGRDVVADFVAGLDRIDLSAIDANEVLAGVQDFSFLGGGSFTAVAGQLRYAASGATGLLMADTNGDGLADFQIQFTGLPALTLADLVL